MTEGDLPSQSPPGEPSPGSEAPRTVAGYRLLRQIGAGGMSAVYQSYDVAAGSPVAVKLLADHLAGQPEFVGRFYREARLSRVLEHQNIVRGFASGFDAAVSKHYLVLEYIDGPTAHGVLGRLGRLPVGMVVRIGIDIARALEYLHDRGYVHRDVKPDNILLHPDGTAKLADLGLAKRLNDDSQLTAMHQGVGTTYYMPYEQAVNANLVDGRSDLFALGATLYHLLAGEVPFSGVTHDEVIREKAHDSFRSLRSLNAAVPGVLADLIESLLACDPRARIQLAGRVAEALTATRLAAKLPSFAEGSMHAGASLDPAPEMPTRTDHRVPPTLPPAGEAFTSGVVTLTATPPASAPATALRRWPWVVGAGAVLLALLASQWSRLRSPPAQTPNPQSRGTVVQETPDAPDGLPTSSYQ